MAAPDGAPCAGENPNPQCKLLAKNEGERLNPGAPGTPGRADPARATVSAVDRPEERGGQGGGFPERERGRHLAAAARVIARLTQAALAAGAVSAKEPISLGRFESIRTGSLS